MRIYRYCSKEVANFLLKDNSIRIGTLHYYKYMEDTQGVSDPRDGEYLDHFTPPPFTAHDLVNHPALQKQIGKWFQVEADSGTKFFGNTFISKKESPNFLMYCTSYKKSRKTMSQFKDADTCIEILNYERFFYLLTKRLKKHFQKNVNFHGIHPVEYGSYKRHRIGFEYLNPALAKTPIFTDQYELRSIWTLKNNSRLNEKYYQFIIPGLSECCRLVSPSEFFD